MYRADKITTVSDAQVFRGKAGFYFLDSRSDAPPVGPVKTRDRAEDAADGVSIDRFYDEVSRLECEPQPAPECDAREYA